MSWMPRSSHRDRGVTILKMQADQSTLLGHMVAAICLLAGTLSHGLSFEGASIGTGITPWAGRRDLHDLPNHVLADFPSSLPSA